MILSVKEPQPVEVGMLRAEQTLFTYLHLAPAPELTKGLARPARPASPTRRSRTAKGAAAAGADERDRRPDRRPRPAPSSSRSRWAAAASSSAACPASPPANVMVIGAGAVGINAAHMAVGMAADVFLFDVSIDALRAPTCSSPGRCRPSFSSTLSIEEMLPGSTS